jgi:hypothetical protein
MNGKKRISEHFGTLFQQQHGATAFLNFATPQKSPDFGFEHGFRLL